VLEVRSREAPFLLEAGQPVGRLARSAVMAKLVPAIRAAPPQCSSRTAVNGPGAE
jgi:2'-deoxycytidine 5'-triphosphate deaminase (DCD)